MDFQEYEVGKWYGWNGGECPVHPKSEVQIVLDTGKAAIRVYADDCGWDHRAIREGKIVAFRVIKPHFEPRKLQEFWVNVYEDGSIGDRYETKEKAVANGRAYRRQRTLKVREVIEE